MLIDMEVRFWLTVKRCRNAVDQQYARLRAGFYRINGNSTEFEKEVRMEVKNEKLKKAATWSRPSL